MYEQLLLWLLFLGGGLFFYWITFKAKGNLYLRVLLLALVSTLFSLFYTSEGASVMCGGRGFPLPYSDPICSSVIVIFLIDVSFWFLPSLFILLLIHAIQSSS